MSFTIAHASSTECAAPARGHSRPIFSIAALKSDAVFGLRDRRRLRPEHLDAEALEHLLLVELESKVERRLPAERRQDGVRPFALEDGRERPPLERLDVRPRRELRDRS